MFPFVETLSSQGGVVRNLPLHEARLNATCQYFWNEKEWVDLTPYVAQIPHSTCQLKVRILYDEKGVQNVSFEPYRRRSIGSLRLLFSDTIEYRFKSTQREALQWLFEQRDGCDDVLIVRNGLLTDTSFSNIALFDGGAWYTPAEPLLEGTMRASLLKEGKLRERDIAASELLSYQKLMLLNALNGWAEIVLPTTAVKGVVC